MGELIGKTGLAGRARNIPPPQGEVAAARAQPQETQFQGRSVATEEGRTELPGAPAAMSPPRPYQPLQGRSLRGSATGTGAELRTAAKFAGLPSREEFVRFAGRPKNDIKFWFFGIRTIRRSTAYKAMLGKLDECRAEAATIPARATAQHLRELDDQLAHLERAASNCAGKGSTARRGAVDELMTEINLRRNSIALLNAQTSRGIDLPDGMSMGEMLDYAGAGVPVEDMKSLSQQGVSPQLAVAMSEHIDPDIAEELVRAGIARSEFVGYLAGSPESAGAILKRVRAQPDGMAAMKEVMQANLGAERLSGYLNNGVWPRAALAYEAGTLPYDLDDVYARHMLNRVPDSEIKFTQRDVQGVPTKLGKGGYNAVYSTAYVDGKTRIFKPLALPSPDRTRVVEQGTVAVETGVDPFNPQTAMRNLATGKLADALGFDVVARTSLGIQNAPPVVAPTSLGLRDAQVHGLNPVVPPEQWKPQLGLVMERAPGCPGGEAPGDWFGHPGVRRELTRLQLLDALTGQGDRHDMNYFVDLRADGQVKVTGIDNDQCFGKKLTDPNGIRQGKSDTNIFMRGCSLPLVVDQEMAAAVERLTPEQIDSAIGNLLTPEEVDATKKRLAGMQQHVRNLRAQGSVMTDPPDNWQLGIKTGDAYRDIARINNAYTSYFVREGGAAQYAAWNPP